MTTGPHQRLRLIMCGGADAGKSTLIDRLQCELKILVEDQLAADGLLAEREQGLTIDVAPRYFSTGTRTFILADTHGHEQCTRDMMTGASTADLAVILVDGLKGMSTQTRRYSYLVSLLGIRHVVVAVNKMDLVDYSERACASIEQRYREFATRIGLTDVTCIPISAMHGDNVAESSTSMPWNTGPSLMHHLEHVVLGDDLSRGDVLAASDAPPAVADQFEATVVWMHDRPMLQGRSYLLKIGAQAAVGATVAPLKYSINVDTLEHVAAKKLELHDIGVCGIELSRPVVFEPYAQNRDLGGFILIDRITNATVGAGMLHFALRRSDNVHWQALDVNKRARGELKGQKPCIIWFTGLSGAGKSTVANLLEKRLHALGHHTYLLDGDNVRHGLNKDLGFTEADRVENVRRVAEVAHLMADAGLIVLVSLISPFRAERRMARGLMDDGEFFEVFIDTPLHVAEERDPKGLYKKARRGELTNFTGIDSPYEVPEAPDVRIDTTQVTPEQAGDTIMEQLRSAGIIDSRSGSSKVGPPSASS